MFDIDDTILQKNISENLKMLMNYIFDSKDCLVYIITSRQFIGYIEDIEEEKDLGCIYLTEEEFSAEYYNNVDKILARTFENDPHNLLKGKAKSDYENILRQIYKKNRNRHLVEWMYCQYSTDNTSELVDKFLEKIGPNIKDLFLRTYGNEEDYYKAGIYKMIQAMNIFRKERLFNWNQVYFFDDKTYMKKAISFLTMYFDRSINTINFFGGKEKPVVFNDLANIPRIYPQDTKKVFIFDLDHTITIDCTGTGNKGDTKKQRDRMEKIINILKYAKQNHVSVYISTARRYYDSFSGLSVLPEEFYLECSQDLKQEKDYNDYLKKIFYGIVDRNVHSDITDKIEELNKEKRVFEWFYCTKDPIYGSNMLTDFFTQMKMDWPSGIDRNNFNKYSPYIKIVQLFDIYNKENLESFSQIHFFDDNKGVSDAWDYISNELCPGEKVNFYGLGSIGRRRKCVEFPENFS